MSSEEEWIESCRGCLTKASLVPIFDERGEIKAKFQEITTILAKPNDGLPAYLCLDCLDTLNFVQQFKKECLKIDTDLRTKIMAKKNARSVPGKKNKDATSMENSKELIDPLNIKQETISEDEIDDNCFYVVIIDEENGKKVAQAIKIENPEDSEKTVKNIKQEKGDDNILSNVTSTAEILETDSMVEALEAMGTEVDHNEEQNGGEMHCEAILREDGEEMDMEQSRLNLMQVLAGNDPETNIMQYEQGFVGEVISGNLDIHDGTAYSEHEVIVGDPNTEYHIITADGEVTALNDEEETITVMQQEDGSFLCDCGDSFMDFGEYETHTAIHNIFKCGVCDRGLESNEALVGHMLLHKSSDISLPCPFCNQNIKRGMLMTHIKLQHNQIRHFCKICKKSFASESNLRRHMQVHGDHKKYECNICFKRFAQKIGMETHRLSHDNAFLKCALCPQEFNTEEECLQHQKEGCIFPPSEERGTEKPHVCEVCGKSYATPSSLKSHMENAHNSQNSEILCSECGEVLPSRKAMYSHSWAHRQGKMKTAKRFSCETCGKSCASHAMLLMHERVHTNERPFKCTKCPLAFKTKTHLTTHQLTHTQEKRFGCSVCMKFFALKGNLVVHLRTHTGERPYVCSICNQGFIDSKYLKKHKQKRHDIANIPWNQYY